MALKMKGCKFQVWIEGKISSWATYPILISNVMYLPGKYFDGYGFSTSYTKNTEQTYCMKIRNYNTTGANWN